MNNIAIFASGSGTNAQNIIKYFHNHHTVRVSLVLSNNKDAGVIYKAGELKVPFVVFNKNDFYNSSRVVEILKDYKITLIILAGFLLQVPKSFLLEFPERIINIHPALLPYFGGKGMYGLNVHNAVLENKMEESGITIHLINEEYDKGKIIFQKKCPVFMNDTAESLALRVQQLEYLYYPAVIEQFIARSIEFWKDGLPNNRWF